MDLAIDLRPARFNVGDVKEMLVGAAAEADAEFLAYGRTRAVATGNECRLGCRPLQVSHDSIVELFEVNQLCLPFDVHAEFFEPLDQESLMFVLRINQRVLIRSGDRSEPAEFNVRRFSAANPQICCVELEPGANDLVDETELAVELERPCLHAERA